MVFSDGEIYKKIKYSDDIKQAKKIQAEINGCPLSTIERIFNEQSVLDEERRLAQERQRRIDNMGKGKYTDEFKEKMMECIKKGMSEKETRVALDSVDANSGFTQLYYKLKKLVPVEIPTLTAKNDGKDTTVKEDLGIKHDGHKSQIKPIDLHRGTTDISSIIKKPDSKIEGDEKKAEVVKPKVEPVVKPKVEEVAKPSDTVVKPVEVAKPKAEEVKPIVKLDESGLVKNPVGSKPSLNEDKKDKKKPDVEKEEKKKDKPKKVAYDLETSDLKELLILLKAKKSTLKNVINTKEMELQILKGTLDTYRALIDDIEDVLEESEEINKC